MNVRSKYVKYFTLLPAVVWLCVFFLVPLAIISVHSFFERGIYGNVIYRLSLDNFNDIIQTTYFESFARTFILAALNIIFCAVLGYPVAYYISFKAREKYQTILLVIVVLPFWTSYLARTYSWFMLLGENGIINHSLQSLHFIKEPLNMLFTPFSIGIGLLYNYLPFMILSIYVGLEKVDKRLLDAARDLGASKAKAFARITFPLSLSGLINGCLLVFVFSLSDYVIPNLLGGSKYLLISNIIANQFLIARNTPLGAALAISFTIAILFLVSLSTKWLKKYSYE